MATSTLRRRENLLGAIDWRRQVEAVLRACEELGARRAWIVGSVAHGTAGPFSDLDVVVEAETEERPIDRAGRFRSVLELEVDLDLLVYTPEELKTLRMGQQPFITEALGDGRLVWDHGFAVNQDWVRSLPTEEVAYESPPQRSFQVGEGRPGVYDPAQAAQDWLRQAESDLEAGRVLAKSGHYAQSCFLAQQAGEKGIKAFLTRAGERLIVGHDVGALLIRAKARDARFASLLGEGAFLDRFYTATRYPDAWSGSATPALKYFERDANDTLAAAEKLIEAARTAMLEWDERGA